MQRRFFSLAFAAIVAAVCAAPLACSGESEGQRCELTDDPGGDNNGPGGSDCAGGLECYAAGSLGGVAAQYAQAQDDPNFGICCPDDRKNATTSICALQPSPPGSDAAPPADSGGSTGDSAVSGDSSAPDASSESDSAATPDASSDAPG
ncbi:MAG: hypothetical protein ACLQVI_33990 [Polyangiaceae bacterium]